MNSPEKNGLRLKGVAFTAYGVQNMATARRFYEEALGLTPADQFGDSWQEYAIGDATFAVIEVNEQTPDYFKGRSFSLALETEDLDAAFATAQQHHLTILEPPVDFPNCRMFVVSDPDGNAVTFHQVKTPSP